MSELSLDSVESLVARVADEFVERQKAGERPDVEEYVARHPEAAATLRPVLVMLALAGPELSGVTGEATAHDGVSGTLGDFRIVREVGRGGMGVVYDAEQLSLRRRVALKVLPFAATMDARRLQRFKNEAYAAASLHHEHIVPVHAVGCERGMHFYAMQFIDGRTLAAVIAARQGKGEPDPERTNLYRGAETVAVASTVEQEKGKGYFREVARLGAEAALALEHAHAMGIVHRDVKPANLLLDGRGKLWVADFGLARLADEPGVTMSGDLLGTLRYMSPEQALAHHGLVDHRTDVYSLGVTLYELLTLRPAVGGKDRQEVLKNIAFEEPVSPRKIDAALPVDLETVVLKAMAKNPRERYATAKELADDLRRWADDRPVQARRPGLGQRLAKFARRHRAEVATAAVGLAVALAVLVGAVGWAAGDRRARELATEAGVRAALDEAGNRLDEDKPQEAGTAVSRAEAILKQGGGHAKMQPLVEVMRRDVRLLLNLEEARLASSEMLGDEARSAAAADAAYQAAFLADGLDVLGAADEAAGRIRDRRIKVLLAGFLDHWSVMRKHARGSADKSWPQLLRAARRADPDPVRDAIRVALEREDKKSLSRPVASAEAGQLTSSSLIALATMVHSGDSDRLVKLLRAAQQRRPDDFWLNQELQIHLLHLSRHEEALGYGRAAVAIRPRSGGAFHNLGVALILAGRRDEAGAAYRQSIHLNPNLAATHRKLAAVLMWQGDLDGGIAAAQAAIRLRHDDAEAHLVLGQGLGRKGDLGGAVDSCSRSVELDPSNADAHHSLGYYLTKMGKDVEGVAEFRAAIARKPSHVKAHVSLGRALLKAGDLDGAIATLTEARRVGPTDALAHLNLGSALDRARKYPDAVAAYREAVRLKPDLVEARANLGVVLGELGDLDGALAQHEAVARLQPDLPEAHLNLGDVLHSKRRFAEALAAYRRSHELGSKLPTWRHPTASLIKKCEEDVELARLLPAVLRGERRPASALEAARLAEVCGKGNPARAAGLYLEAFAGDPKLAEDLQAQHREKAACFAVLAGAAASKDAGRWRGQALAWLRGDLLALARLFRTDPKSPPLVRDRMVHWRGDPDFAAVRDAAGLAKLDAQERERWLLLWAEVDRLAMACGERPTATPIK